MQRPNILLIMTDQQRRETLGVHPGAWMPTPQLDRLAADGIHYPQAFAPCPICVPARITLLTGLHANALAAMPGTSPGTFRHPLDNGGTVPDPQTTLPALLGQSGYRTAVIGKTHMAPYYQPLGFEHSELMEMDPGDDYSRYLRTHGYDIAPQKVDLGACGLRAHESPVPLEHYPTTWVTRQTRRYLESAAGDDRPFFLWCSYLRPHNPYNPPPPYHGSIDPDTLPRPVRSPDDLDKVPGYRDRYHALGYDTMADAQTQASRARYCECVRLIDDCVGQIRNTLEATGLWENTVVIFVSDHGDLLGDHFLWHKTSAYEPSAGIPLLMRIPGGPRGVVCEQLVSLIDLAPTCLDLAGLDVPAAYRGRSLLDLQRRDAESWRDGVLIECGYYPSTLLALRTHDWKYVHHMNGGFEELYDLTADPHELNNLARANPKRRQQLRQALIELIGREGAAWYLDGNDLRAVPYDARHNYHTGQRLAVPLLFNTQVHPRPPAPGTVVAPRARFASSDPAP